MSITQAELARKFKVSRMTISRALRNLRGVGKKLREKILGVAREQGYNPESGYEARRLRSLASGTHHESKVICVIAWNLYSQCSEGMDFNQRILKGIWDGAQAMDNEIVMVPRVGKTLPRVVLRRQVDGVIWLLSDENILRGGHIACPVPWVSVLFEIPGTDVVKIDNVGSARSIGSHLASLGHRKVAFVGPDSPQANERLEGLRLGLQEGGATIPDDFVCKEPFAMAPRTTDQLMARLFERNGSDGRGWTAVAVYNDFMAATVIRFLRARGLKVPDDVSVTGFDGISSITPDEPVTTAVVPLEELGGEAVRLLGWRMKHPNAPRRRIMLEAPFKKHGTSAPPGMLRI